MNFLRRLYLLLVSLLLVIIVLSLLLSPETVITWVGRVSELTPFIRVLVAVVLTLLLLALIYIQIRPDPRTNMTGLMMRGSGAVTEVSIESARDRILNAVNAVPDVVSAEAQVKPVNGKADIEMQVAVLGGDVKLPVKQKEINRALKQVIDKQLGLRMAGQPRIHIRLQDQFISKPIVTPPVKEEPVLSAPIRPSIVPAPPSVVELEEPEPEVKSGGGLFDRWRIGGKTEEEDTTVQLPGKPVQPSEESPQEPITFSDVRPSTVSDHKNKEDELSVPSLSSLLSDEETSQRTTSNLDLPARPVIVTVDDEKTLKLDLDEELAHSAMDDFGDDVDEIDKEPNAGETPKSDSDEMDENRPRLA